MVKFKYPGSAENCIKVMNGRYFDGRQIICEYYDGVTDYRVNFLGLNDKYLSM
jgi:hypothetical protein